MHPLSLSLSLDFIFIFYFICKTYMYVCMMLNGESRKICSSLYIHEFHRKVSRIFVCIDWSC